MDARCTLVPSQRDLFYAIKSDNLGRDVLIQEVQVLFPAARVLELRSLGSINLVELLGFFEKLFKAAAMLGVSMPDCSAAEATKYVSRLSPYLQSVLKSWFSVSDGEFEFKL